MQSSSNPLPTAGGLDLRVDKSKPHSRFLLLHTWSNDLITADMVPWVVADIAAAEHLAILWLQILTDKLKGLENDNHWDQLYGTLNLASGILAKKPASVPQLPTGTPDMDNAIGTGNYGSEYFELIVGKDTSNNIYTCHFAVGNFVNDAATASYTYRLIFQTTRNQANPNNLGSTGFSNQPLNTAISSAAPRCTQRPSSFNINTVSSSAAFPIMLTEVLVQNSTPSN